LAGIADAKATHGNYIPAMLTRRDFFLASAAALVARRAVSAAVAPSVVTVYKDAGCECCGRWVKHLSSHGFVVSVRDVLNVDEIKRTMLVPTDLVSCHTAVVGAYVVEGHVPADVIKKMLAEKPAIQGISAPGMPSGSPGMETTAKADKYDIIAFTRDGKKRVYASR
jgi:hypothetical protein